MCEQVIHEKNGKGMILLMFYIISSNFDYSKNFILTFEVWNVFSLQVVQ